jgi:hypothetical protein
MIWPGIVLIIAILLTVENALRIGFLSELNYNEGWNVYNAQRLINNELIYDGNFWRVNNYPIGSFLLVAGVNLMAGDLLLAGRVVALVAFAALGLLATIATRRFGGSRADAVFGAGCALGFCYIVAPSQLLSISRSARRAGYRSGSPAVVVSAQFSSFSRVLSRAAASSGICYPLAFLPGTASTII